MGVMFQAFYWDCPSLESREHKWWVEVKNRIPSLKQAGFTALWLPPVNKAAGWKSMGYAFILTHEGYPCVFWQDYFNWNLAQAGNRNGIAALVQVHEQFAGGATRVLYVDENLYVMQRDGQGTQRGLILVLNNSGQWNGTSVQTKWNNTRFVPQAWRGHNDASVPLDKWTNDSGWGAFWAPPRGYVVYAPQ